MDVWSLGCCLYYIIVKTDPFEGADHNETKRNILNMEIGPHEIEDQIFRQLILKCLVIDPKSRATCAEVMQFQDLLEIELFGNPISQQEMSEMQHD